MNNLGSGFNVGALVEGAPTSPRSLRKHSELLAVFADGEYPNEGESYLSHFTFGPEMVKHYRDNGNSVAGYIGPCCCRWLTWDIDRADLAAALQDARRLVQYLADRYPENEPAAFFSGNKGFHVCLELVNQPPPAVGFNLTARAFATTAAARAGVRVDEGVYDANRILRLPNTRHPKTGLFKRRIRLEELFALEANHLRDLAQNPVGDGMPTGGKASDNLAADWVEAETGARTTTATRAAIRQEHGTTDARAPKWFVDFLRFGVDMGERHSTLFRSAAWLTEQGAPPSLTSALLTEPGQDVGLTPSDVARQIKCGISHARKQGTASGAADDPKPPDDAPEEIRERWAIRHESDSLPPGAMDFPFGHLAPERTKGNE